MNIAEKLSKVQKTLKAPKNQFNSFGKYHYRSCEDILEAAKPLCIENGLVLMLDDEVVNIGDRYYVKATATVLDTEAVETLSATAYARESYDKKGCDDSQITGGASSYARKYALNGLFCIDDTKDADTEEHANIGQNQSNKGTPKNEPTKSEQALSEAQLKRLYAIATAHGVTSDGVKEYCAKSYGKEPKSLNKAEYDAVCARLESKKKE